MEADFKGYATKAGIKCADGKTITSEAFAHMHGETVPLVWQHSHNSPLNILGKVTLTKRKDGIYAEGFFNDTPNGQQGKALVQHGDIKALSIYANQLQMNRQVVTHGQIREVSLVLAGANPGAFIESVKLQHGDDPTDLTELEGEYVISMGIAPEIMHADSDDGDSDGDSDDEGDDGDEGDEGDELGHAADDATLQDVYNSMDEDQKNLLHYMVGTAAAAKNDELAQSGTGTDDEDDSLAHDQEGSLMPPTRNVFDQNAAPTGPSISHSQLLSIVQSAKENNGSFKEGLKAFLATDKDVLAHGITDIELLFPDAKAITNTPEFISRRMDWVNTVLTGTRHAPFSKIKTILADITADEARAKGYVKGTQKVEEVLTLLRRTTGPTTIYKKQSLDRDDIVDIVDIDIVLWLKAEMRLMIEEEVARCILVGDGRSVASTDKVKDPAGSNDGVGIRSILHDDDLYAVKYDLTSNVAAKDAVKGLVRARSRYRGSGKPTLFISETFLTDIMLEEDKFGRALYETEQQLMDKLRVSKIVTIDLFDDHPDLFAIMVSLADYTIGSTRGGELTSFQDFDIDFNKEKYLQETRLSGGLTKPFSAVVIRRAAGVLAVAQAPSFNGATNTITIPDVPGVFYTINDEVVIGDVVIDKPTTVEANPADGHYLAFNTTRDWTYAP